MLKQAIEKIADSMHLKKMPASPLMPHISIYNMDSAFGDGHCSIYTLGQIAAFVSPNLFVKENLFFECLPGFAYIGWFSGINAAKTANGAACPLPSRTAFAGMSSCCKNIHFYKKGDLSGLLVIFSPEKYEKYLRIKFGIHISQALNVIKKISGSVHTPEIPLIIRQIEEHLAGSAGLTSGLFCESKLHELISVFLQSVQNTEFNDRFYEKAAKINREDVIHIATVTEHICANPNKNTNLEELAALACMSPAKLKYTFKAVQGCTVSEFRDGFKTERARDLLINTDMSVKEISHLLAFAKTGSFTHFFCRRTGFTPSAYRSLHRTS